MLVVIVPTVADPVVPEVAVNVLDAPEQIVAGTAVTAIFAFVFTVITELAVLVQPFTSVPVTVYVVVVAGFADTVPPVVADKPLAGDQA